MIYDQKVRIRKWGDRWAVEVSVLKDNTIRGDRYWVSKIFKVYDKKQHAETFARRYGWDG